MPYELRKQDGGYKVGKKGSSKTFSKKPMSKEKAKAQLAALHINAPKESITMKTKEQIIREYIRKEIKKALHEEEKAKEDFDGDGKVESSKDEWKGSRDAAIKASKGKK